MVGVLIGAVLESTISDKYGHIVNYKNAIKWREHM